MSIDFLLPSKQLKYPFMSFFLFKTAEAGVLKSPKGEQYLDIALSLGTTKIKYLTWSLNCHVQYEAMHKIQYT